MVVDKTTNIIQPLCIPVLEWGITAQIYNRIVVVNIFKILTKAALMDIFFVENRLVHKSTFRLLFDYGLKVWTILLHI